MLRRLLTISALLMVLILISGGVLWVRNLVPQQRRFTLSNGVIVSFNQATFGTNHSVASGGEWRRMLPPFIARRLLGSFSGSTFTTPSPSVVLWFERRQIPGSPIDFAFSLVHPDGTETPFETGRFFARYTPTNSLEGLSGPLPQRENVLRIRFYETVNYHDDVKLLGEFTVSNPNVSRAPMKPAPPLPQTSSDGDLQVALASLESPTRRSKGDTTNFLNQWMRARFQVNEGGTASTNWEVVGMEANDSTGNKLTSGSRSSWARKSFENFECQPVL